MSDNPSITSRAISPLDLHEALITPIRNRTTTTIIEFLNPGTMTEKSLLSEKPRWIPYAENSTSPPKIE